SVPEEDVKRTKPARRRRTARSAATGDLEGTASALALPAEVSKTRRPRKTANAEKETAAVSAAVPAEKPKPVRKRKVSTSRKK
ncbi:MAG: hypothetical protein WBP75_03005, partial [Candidatus Cybelea sp.]